jgi:hypothetical protein
MAHSDSEGETIDDLEFETRSIDADAEEENDVDEDLLGALDNGVDEATEADEVCSRINIYYYLVLTSMFMHRTPPQTTRKMRMKTTMSQSLLLMQRLLRRPSLLSFRQMSLNKPRFHPNHQPPNHPKVHQL